MFTDECRRTVWDQLRQRDLRAFQHLLRPEVFAQAAKNTGVRLGQSALSRVNMVWLGIASALYTGRDFASVLCLTLKLLQDAPNWNTTPEAAAQRNAKRRRRKQCSKRRNQHHPQGSDPTQVSEEAFVKARRCMPLGFWVALLLILADRFEEAHGRWTRWKKYRLLALDGTTIALQNWQPLAAGFGVAKNGKGGSRVQARLVMLQLPLVRLPWRYELCPVSEGEKTIARRLLGHVRPNDLVLMDKGFWSYGLFWQLQNQQAFFAIRLFASVRLRTLRRLGPQERLVHWRPSDRKWHTGEWPDAITLRIIDYQIPGFRKSALVTNVLDPQAITRDEWLRLALTEAGRVVEPGLYHRRWEIETTFRELKVQQGMQGGLRGRTPEAIRFEVAGHVLLYFLVRWLMVEAAEQAGIEDPLRLSFTHALRELKEMATTLIQATPQRAAQVLLPRLLQRVASHLVPLRPGRHYPRPHETKIRNKGRGKVKLPSKLAQQAA
jgi:hypothetical protein